MAPTGLRRHTQDAKMAPTGLRNILQLILKGRHRSQCYAGATMVPKGVEIDPH